MNILKSLFFFIFPPIFTEAELERFPKASQPQDKNAYSLFDYQNPQVKKLIRHLKNTRDPHMKKILAQKMYSFLLPTLAEYHDFHQFSEPVIIPVPITKKRKHERGFNQCDDLAKFLSRQITGSSYDTKTIQRIEKPGARKQSLIHNRSERYANTKNSFVISNKNTLKNQDIIIVDDLVTSGATLFALQTEIAKSKPRNIIAITIAH